MLEHLEKAARTGAKIVVFPECALTGYCFTSREEAWPLAETVPEWQEVAAVFVHLCFYALMLAQPVTGWLMSSASGIPVDFLGLFTLPKFDGVVALMGVIDDERALSVVVEQLEKRGGFATSQPKGAMRVRSESGKEMLLRFEPGRTPTGVTRQ